MRRCWHLAQPPSWWTTLCRLSATVYSIYSHLPSILQAFLHPQPEDAPCCGDRDPLIRLRPLDNGFPQARTITVIWWWNALVRRHYPMVTGAISQLVICPCPNSERLSLVKLAVSGRSLLYGLTQITNMVDMTDLSLAPTCAPAGWHRTANSTDHNVA